MLKVTRDHPTFQLKPALDTVCSPFLKQHGFSYFQYLRCFDDGSCSLMCTETGLFEEMAQIDNQPVVFSSFTEEHQHCHSYWFLWDEELPAFPVNLGREKYGLHHGLTLVRRSKNYYDMIAVALPHEKRNVGSFYLTKQKAIESFIQYFDKSHADLIKKATRSPLILPPSYRDENYDKICLKKGRIQVQSPSGLIEITHQELACLRLLAQGLTYKEIAKELQLSWRTVETYMERCKRRSLLSSRNDLIRLITACP